MMKMEGEKKNMGEKGNMARRKNDDDDDDDDQDDGDSLPPRKFRGVLYARFPQGRIRRLPTGK